MSVVDAQEREGMTDDGRKEVIDYVTNKFQGRRVDRDKLRATVEELKDKPAYLKAPLGVDAPSRLDGLTRFADDETLREVGRLREENAELRAKMIILEVELEEAQTYARNADNGLSLAEKVIKTLQDRITYLESENDRLEARQEYPD